MISSMVAASSPSRSIFSSKASTRASWKNGAPVLYAKKIQQAARLDRSVTTSSLPANIDGLTLIEQVPDELMEEVRTRVAAMLD